MTPRSNLLVLVLTILVCAFTLNTNKVNADPFLADTIPLIIAFDEDTVYPGDTLGATISLGTEESPANDIVSVKFNIDYDRLDLDINRHLMGFSNSWFANDQSYTAINHVGNQSIMIALYRTDGDPRSGHGEIMTNVVEIENIEQKRFEVRRLLCTLKNAVTINRDQEEVPIKLIVPNDIIFISSSSTSVKNSQQAQSGKVYPNPFTNRIHFDRSEDVISVSIFDLMGKMIYFDDNVMEISINTTEFESGIYLVRIKDSKEVRNVRMIKVKH